MKKIYFLSALIFFLSASLFAQDHKWSVEANYPFSSGDDLGNDAKGIIDLGVKYRFLDFNIVKIGAGINTGIYKADTKDFNDPSSYDYTETHWLIKPEVFAEFSIPGAKKLHPSIGLGYTFVESKYDGVFDYGPNEPPFPGAHKITESEGGINVNLGLSYDITKRFFLKTQVDLIRNVADKTKGEGETLRNIEHISLIKVGVGFRF
ncbi:outer membrane beta-barrel protein [Zobellia russellii]|uniref:outer membrane beta-barrel protein n=1 Tax=Zobellia russellii TaxID=248907 RepID=UPI001BFFA983|nr:outer membrane beta-barrel protein [Zobellia russellii]MBT9186873.1 porin family protein [Zobellia russellii]